MGTKEYVLIVVLYGSLIAGMVFPGISSIVAPSIKYLMMGMLFLAFIKISPNDVWTALRSNPVSMAIGSVLRLLVAPALAYYTAVLIYPPLALPVLLLAGVSTGVSSPFFTSLCGGNISFCLVMAVITSMLVPVSLPFMVKVMAHSTLDYDLYAMALFLAMIILVPLVVAFTLKKVVPGLIKAVNQVSYPVSLLIVSAINFGALGRYIPYLKANPEQIVYSGLFATGLSFVLALMGWYASNHTKWADKVAASGSQVWVNNVLIIALAVHMDNPLAAALAVFYFLPYYGFVIIFSVMAKRQERQLIYGS